MTTSDNDLFDLTVPETPGKGLYLNKYKIPRVNQAEKMETDEFPASTNKNMENQANCSLPTPAQRTNNQQNQSKITLTDHSKKMVWGELGKIKSIRQTISKAPFLATDITQAKSEEKILPAFSLHKSIPLLPGGKPSWAFQVEWEKTLAECSQNLMELTSAYLLKDKVPSLEKMATDAANRATADVGKALPADEKEKGLKLFEIVNNSMKRLRRVKAGRVTKPKTNHPATKNHNGNRKAKPGKKSASHRRLKY